MSIKRIIVDENGSSSVLIIIVLLCLLTFGMLTLMSSFVELKQSTKAEALVVSYYALDDQGALFMQDVAQILRNAADITHIFMDKGSIGKDELLSDAYKSDETKAIIASIKSSYSAKQEIYNRIFIYIALQLLAEHNYLTIPEPSDNHIHTNSIKIKQEIPSDSNANIQSTLFIELDVLPVYDDYSSQINISKWYHQIDEIELPDNDSFKIWPGISSTN